MDPDGLDIRGGFSGDQADVDLARGQVGGLAQPQRGAQLSPPPLRTCHEAIGHRHVHQQSIEKLQAYMYIIKHKHSD